MKLNKKAKLRNDYSNTIQLSGQKVSTRLNSMGRASDLQEVMQKSDYENLIQ